MTNNIDNPRATFKWGYAFRDETGELIYVLEADAPEEKRRIAPLLLDSRLFDEV